MIRTRFARLAAATVVAVALLPLSGCIYAQIPVDVPVVGEPSAPPAPSESPSAVSDTMTFDEGLALTSSTYVQWGDGLMLDDAWEVASPDDGNGNWSYSTVDGTCTAHFWQGTVTPDLLVTGDDSATTDAVMAFFLGGTPADIAGHTKTGAFSYQVGGNDGVENRQVLGQDGERTWIMSARAFSAVGVGLYVITDCAGSQADVEAALASINEKNAIVVVP